MSITSSYQAEVLPIINRRSSLHAPQLIIYRF